MLRFITCGSVDDGKSTLIGRLLYEPGLVFEDQLAALAADSRAFGTQGDELDFALLLGRASRPSASRGSPSTSPTASSPPSGASSSSPTLPGHEQYTRNMVTGASTADCAVLLVDARKGVLTQTRRHSYIVSLLGFATSCWRSTSSTWSTTRRRASGTIEADYRAFARRARARGGHVHPALGACGATTSCARSEPMPWYAGPTLLEYLETVEIDEHRLASCSRSGCRCSGSTGPDSEFRGCSRLDRQRGRPTRRSDSVVQPSGRESRVERIVTYDGELDAAVAGQSVTLTLADELDVSRGDVIAERRAPAEVGRAVRGDDRLDGRASRCCAAELPDADRHRARAPATTAPLKFKLNVDTLEHVAAEQLELNEIGVCELELDRPIAFDPYSENRDMGGFVLIDRITNATVGAGMLNFELRRSQNVHWQALDVDKQRARAS